MNRTEHLIVILGEEAAEISKEAVLLAESINHVQRINAVIADLPEAFKPLLDEYADLLGMLKMLNGKTVDIRAVLIRQTFAEQDIAADSGDEIGKLSRLLAQIAGDANTVGIRASKAARFGLEEVQPGQAIPYTNEARLLSACNDLAGIIACVTNRYNIEVTEALEARILAKTDKVERFLAYSAECGTLQA